MSDMVMLVSALRQTQFEAFRGLMLDGTVTLYTLATGTLAWDPDLPEYNVEVAPHASCVALCVLDLPEVYSGPGGPIWRIDAGLIPLADVVADGIAGWARYRSAAGATVADTGVGITPVSDEDIQYGIELNSPVMIVGGLLRITSLSVAF